MLSYAYAGRSCFTLRKGNTLPWTAYSTECLDILEKENEFESDALLVQLVKLRRISERVKDLPWSSLAWSSLAAGVDGIMTAPVSFYLKSLESQLQDLKNNIPKSVLDNGKLLSPGSFAQCILRRS